MKALKSEYAVNQALDTTKAAKKADKRTFRQRLQFRIVAPQYVVSEKLWNK